MTTDYRTADLGTTQLEATEAAAAMADRSTLPMTVYHDGEQWTYHEAQGRIAREHQARAFVSVLPTRWFA